MNPDKPMTLEEYKQRKIEEDKLFRTLMEGDMIEAYKRYVDNWEYEDSPDGYGKRRKPRNKPTNITPPKKKRKKNKKTHR